MHTSSPMKWRLDAITPYLIAAALVSCSDSGAVGDERASAGPATSGTTGAGGASGNSVTASSSVASSSNATSSSSATSSNNATSSSSVAASSSSTGASGGSSSTGAVAGVGGLTSSGGAPSSGGSAGTANTSSSGGMAGAGGVAGTGGATEGVTGTGTGGAGGTSSTCPPATPLMGGQQYCSNSKGNAGNGYGYELWAEETGEGCMTVRGVDATFGATWSNVEDFLARVGLDFDQTRTHAQIGAISAEFAETKTDDGGLTYIGVYGWTVNPLREYYILDDWGATKPAGTSSDGTPRTYAGTVTADGATYDVWTKLRENKPAITGDSETFEQYFSIRETARQCGRISVSEHFSQWEDLGLPLGNLHEAKLLVEAQGNSGDIEFTTATFFVD